MMKFIKNIKYNRLFSKRLLNVVLRAISMLSRFLLIIVIAKLLPLSDLGTFGLLVAGIGFAVLFLGFDYYTYSNRELLSVSKDEWSRIVVNQVYAYLPIYFIFIPIAWGLYRYEVLPSGYFIWFLILLVIEHISIEQNRLLNTMEKQLSATFVLFLRSGLWVLFMLPFMIYIDEFKNLETVLYAWFVGSVASIVFGGIIIKKSIKNWKLIKPSYKWIIKGYKIGLLFILGTISFRAISTGDRFILEQWSTVDMVGVYVFYVSLTLGASAFIHAGVIVFSTPKIIIAYQKNDFILFKYLMNKFFKELSFSIFMMIVILYLSMPYVIDWVGKETYLVEYDLFYIILGTTALTVMGSHPGTYLYASRRDKYILLSNLSTLFIFIILLIFFYFTTVGLTALYKVSLSVMITFLWLLLSKYVGYFYYSRGDKG